MSIQRDRRYAVEISNICATDFRIFAETIIKISIVFRFRDFKGFDG